MWVLFLMLSVKHGKYCSMYHPFQVAMKSYKQNLWRIRSLTKKKKIFLEIRIYQTMSSSRIENVSYCTFESTQLAWFSASWRSLRNEWTNGWTSVYSLKDWYEEISSIHFFLNSWVLSFILLANNTAEQNHRSHLKNSLHRIEF